MFVDDGFSVLDTCGIMAQCSNNTQEVKVEKIAIEKIVPNPYQPRKTFDDEGLADLSASIAQYGVLQPLLVAPAENGDYMLIAVSGSNSYAFSKYGSAFLNAASISTLALAYALLSR